MQIRGIFNFFFGLSLYSGQAAKCSRITPPAYGMDATKALEHDGVSLEHDEVSLEHDEAALEHDEVVQGLAVARSDGRQL